MFSKLLDLELFFGWRRFLVAEMRSEVSGFRSQNSNFFEVFRRLEDRGHRSPHIACGVVRRYAAHLALPGFTDFYTYT